jgi:hypothetical protein
MIPPMMKLGGGRDFEHDCRRQAGSTNESGWLAADVQSWYHRPQQLTAVG